MTRGFLFQKRLMDLAITSVLVLLVLWWLLPVLALLVLIRSRGTILVSEHRTGRRGQSFRYVRFRTTRFNAWGVEEKTSLGNFLQLSGLESLPLLLQVLLGHMSLVGPRPFSVRDDERCAALLKGYYARYAFKPGLVDMASIKVKQVLADDAVALFHLQQWDAYYGRNASLRLDWKILYQSLRRRLRALKTGRPSETIILHTPTVKLLKASPRFGTFNN